MIDKALGRYFLKDTIRKEIDFRFTDQGRNLPPPVKPVAEDVPRVKLPDPADTAGRSWQPVRVA